MADFYERYGVLNIEGLPKYAKLREAFRDAIKDEYWTAGAKLPPEAEIAKTTPYSLGTVQKALKALVEEGILVRYQGRGTYVAEELVKMDIPWHCRFTADNQEGFLSVYPKVVLRTHTKIEASWAHLLNPISEALIQIDRVIDIGHKFSVYIKFFLDEAKFGRFFDIATEVLEKTNFKTILHNEFNTSITHMSYAIRFSKFPEEISEAIQVPQKTIGVVYEIVANSGQKNPVYYQEIFIPPNDCKLYISDSSNIPEYWT